MIQQAALAPALLKLHIIALHPGVIVVLHRVSPAHRKHSAQVVRQATFSHRMLVRANATRQLSTSEANVLHLSHAPTASSILAITHVTCVTISVKNAMITLAVAILATLGTFSRQAAAIGTYSQLVACSNLLQNRPQAQCAAPAVSSAKAIKVDAFAVRKDLVLTVRILHNARRNVNTQLVPSQVIKTDFVWINRSVKRESSQSSKLQLNKLTGAAGMLLDQSRTRVSVVQTTFTVRPRPLKRLTQ